MVLLRGKGGDGGLLGYFFNSGRNFFSKKSRRAQKRGACVERVLWCFRSTAFCCISGAIPV